MTQTTDTGASVNGAVPGGQQQAADAGQRIADAYSPPGASTAETLMGLIGIVFAVGLLAIGLDLVTGGAVSRLFGAPEQASDNAGG